MAQLQAAVLCLALTLFQTILTGLVCSAVTETGSRQNDLTEDMYSDEVEVVDGYSALSVGRRYVDGQCWRTVNVTGPGLRDSLDIPCSTEGGVIANDRVLVVGSSLYSDSPGALVMLTGETCVLRLYYHITANQDTRLHPLDCQHVRDTIKTLKAENEALVWDEDVMVDRYRPHSRLTVSPPATLTFMGGLKHQLGSLLNIFY